MTNKPPAFQLYAADFYMDTITWDCDDVGAYFRLLMWSWVNGPLPDDKEKLCKIAGKTKQKFKKNWSILSQKFSQDGTGCLINLRLERTRERQAKYLKKQAEYGKLGAEKRWGSDSNPNGDPNSDPMATPHKKNGPSSSSSPSFNSELPIGNPAVADELPYQMPVKKVGESQHFSVKVGDHFESIKKHCAISVKLKTQNGKGWNPYQWVQEKTNKGLHPGAIDETIQAMADPKIFHGIEGEPYPYANTILKTKNQNWNERDAVKIHKQFKKMTGEELSVLTNGMIKKIG